VAVSVSAPYKSKITLALALASASVVGVVVVVLMWYYRPGVSQCVRAYCASACVSVYCFCVCVSWSSRPLLNKTDFSSSSSFLKNFSSTDLANCNSLDPDESVNILFVG
jgi:hypothetical protein